MKHFSILLSLLLVVICSMAQPVCTPDPNPLWQFPPPSYNEIDTMYNGYYYEDVLTVFAPDSLYVNTTIVQIDSMRVDSISGFPIGIDYECDVPDCLFVPPVVGCMLLSGTPNDTTGVYDVRIHYCVFLPILPDPICLVYPEDTAAAGYAYRLGSSPISSNLELEKEAIGDLSCFPNPVTTSSNFQFLPHQNGLATVAVYNSVGQSVFREQVSVTTQEMITVGFKRGDLTSGIYFYSVELNGQTEVVKFVLSE